MIDDDSRPFSTVISDPLIDIDDRPLVVRTPPAAPTQTLEPRLNARRSSHLFISTIYYYYCYTLRIIVHTFVILTFILSVKPTIDHHAPFGLKNIIVYFTNLHLFDRYWFPLYQTIFPFFSPTFVRTYVSYSCINSVKKHMTPYAL